MTVPDDSSYDPSVHMSFNDITVDDPRVPTVLRVTIKQSKTNPFRKRINLFLGKISMDLCPVVAMLNYLVLRGPRAGPLFHFKDNHYLP